METERVLPLEQRPQEFLPTSLNCIQFQHLHLICRPHSAVCRRCKMDIAFGMPRLPDVKIAQPDLLIQSTGLSRRNGMKAVKVIDIFGNDTMTLVPVTIS